MNSARSVVLAALAACVPMPALADDSPAKVHLEFRRAETKAADGLTEATIAGSAAKVYLHKEADLTNEDVAEATVDNDKENGVVVKLTFTKEGAKKAAKLSEEHKDKPVAIVIDGKVVSAPVIRAKFGESVEITGHFTKEEAERIVKPIQRRSP